MGESMAQRVTAARLVVHGCYTAALRNGLVLYGLYMLHMQARRQLF